MPSSPTIEEISLMHVEMPAGRRANRPGNLSCEYAAVEQLARRAQHRRVDHRTALQGDDHAHLAGWMLDRDELFLALRHHGEPCRRPFGQEAGGGHADGTEHADG